MLTTENCKKSAMTNFID